MQSTSSHPPYDLAAQRAISMHLFEDVLGACRTSDGHLWEGRLFLRAADSSGAIAPTQQIPLDDDDEWKQAYAGPNFLTDANYALAAEEALVLQGLMQPYIRKLLELNGRDWQRLTTDSEVYEFWFSLAHMMPWQRAVAAASMTGMDIACSHQHRRRECLKTLAKQVVQLIGAMQKGGMPDRHRAGNRFRDLMHSLTVPQAVRLASVVDLGRSGKADGSIEVIARDLRSRLSDQNDVLAYLLEDGTFEHLLEGLRLLE
jgi:hypothetical protein